MLEPCHCLALAYDDGAYACGSIPELARCYIERVLLDADRYPGDRGIYVAGYQ